MKNSAAFESTNAGGQVHVFTSFPESHVDDDSENNVTNEYIVFDVDYFPKWIIFVLLFISYKYMASPDGSNKQQQQANSSGVLDENFLADDSLQTPNYSVWQLEYYQKFFNVSTNDVVGRIVGSMVPTFNQSFLLNQHLSI